MSEARWRSEIDWWAPRVNWLSDVANGCIEDDDLCDLGADHEPVTLGDIKSAVRAAAERGDPGFVLTQ